MKKLVKILSAIILVSVVFTGCKGKDPQGSSRSRDTDDTEETVEVDENFSFLNTDTQPYIYDETTGVTVKIAMAGQDPHAIMVPYEFRYPLEKVLVSRAYPKFNSWGTGAVITDEGFKWYLFLDETLVTQAIPTLVVPYKP